jgi:xanthine phosphoribosyltransferase
MGIPKEAYGVGSEPARQPILNLSWDTINQASDILAHQMKPLKLHTIVAIARGGLIPATLLSHRLNVNVEVITASAYEGTRRTLQKPIQIEGFKDEFLLPGVAFVDDVMDSGDTWDAILHLRGGITADVKGSLWTIAKKDKARFVNWHNYYLKVPSDVWVKFPWESDT